MPEPIDLRARRGRPTDDGIRFDTLVGDLRTWSLDTVVSALVAAFDIEDLAKLAEGLANITDLRHLSPDRGFDVTS